MSSTDDTESSSARSQNSSIQGDNLDDSHQPDANEDEEEEEEEGEVEDEEEDDNGEKSDESKEDGSYAEENQSSDNEESRDQSKGSKGSVTTSEESEEETVRAKRPRRFGMSDETLKFLEDEKILRRSSRRRTADRKIENDVDASPPKKKRKKKNVSESDTSSDSESESSDAASYRKSARRGGNRGRARGKTRKCSAGDDERSTRRNAENINYRDISSGEEINSDDVLEWEEGDASNAATTDQNAPGTETIEKVIRHRAGLPGATGSITTCYNVEDKGDPNERAAGDNPENLERQFLIKWCGWSHLHNTWESEASLRSVNAKGLKKIDNYLKRLREIEEWKRAADKEYIESFACEQEMNEELFEQYKVVERVIAHQVSRDKGEEDGVEYYVKWSGLPYSDCTWEDSHLIARRYQEKIDAYYTRCNNPKIPNRTCPVLRKRPKFRKLEDVSFLLKPGDAELRDYQLEGVNWMLHAWSKENSVILADEMGLGKTIQCIAFLSALFHVHDLYGPFLVVVPLSTMAAWQQEFENWARDLNVITYMGDGTSRDYIRQFEMYIAGSKRLKVNCVLTTYEILLKDKIFLGAYDWAVLAVDEAHRLKNDESLLYRCLFEFSTNFRLLITGTPLQNSLKELWALLHFIMPLKFESWSDFEKDHHDSDHKAIASLHRKLEPFLLRRVKKDVEKSLPAKVEQILRVDMTAQQKQFYKWILTKNYKELSKGVKGSINGFVNLLMELKKCCNHASLVRTYDHYEQGAAARLQQLLKSSGKLILLDKLLCRLHETGHRVLIFSQMVMMLDIVQEYLQLRRFPSQRLDGSMRADLRRAALDHFNAAGSSDFCFLLSTHAGGLGINLATADTVIIFDSDWNPQNDLQAMSRAHRIGQKKQVNIYRLVTKASVEEEIVERAKRKLVLDHLVIQRMDTTGRTVLSKGPSANGSVPFEKHELNAILKFGAEELFKEKEGEEQEPEVDIDNILQGAETRECEQQNHGSELLNAFKYANFAIDEEKDVSVISKENGSVSKEGRDKNWDEIIPEDERQRVEAEERERAEKDLFLGPRNRNKIPQSAADEGESDDESSVKKRSRAGKDSESEDDASDEERPKKNKKKGIFGFTDIEIRKFVKSFRRFAAPLTRLEAIAQDAELEEHSKPELEQLAKELLDGCQRAVSEYEKTVKDAEKKVAEDGKKKHDRGPVFKLGGIDVYVRPLMKMHADLEPLNQLVMKSGESGLKLYVHPKVQKGWDVVWESADDVALLRGIYRYGLGSWEAIKMDPEYGLVDKIWLKDKNTKPQAKHLQARAELLLKHLARYAMKEEGKAKKKHHVSKAGASVTSSSKLPKPKAMKVETGERKRKKELKESSDINEGIRDATKANKTRETTNVDRLIINTSKYGEEMEKKSSKAFQDCVKNMRPVQKYFKKLVACEDLSSADSLRYLLKLGDHIMKHLEKLSSSESSSDLEKWHSYLWIFVSRFIPEPPSDLLQKYRSAARYRAEQESNGEHRKHSHHHQHHGHHEGKGNASHDDKFASTHPNKVRLDTPQKPNSHIEDRDERKTDDRRLEHSEASAYFPRPSYSALHVNSQSPSRDHHRRLEPKYPSNNNYENVKSFAPAQSASYRDRGHGYQSGSQQGFYQGRNSRGSWERERSDRKGPPYYNRETDRGQYSSSSKQLSYNNRGDRDYRREYRGPVSSNSSYPSTWSGSSGGKRYSSGEQYGPSRKQGSFEPSYQAPPVSRDGGEKEDFSGLSTGIMRPPPVPPTLSSDQSGSLGDEWRR